MEDLYANIRPDLDSVAVHAAEDSAPELYAEMFAEARSNSDIESVFVRMANSGHI